MDEKTLELVRLLLARLERISADSYWAHRASGVRGSLLKMLDRADIEFSFPNNEMNRLMDLGFTILEKASGEKFKNIDPGCYGHVVQKPSVYP